MTTSPTDHSALPIVDPETRRSRLVHRVGQLVSAGGEVEEQHRFMAIVVRHLRPSLVPNLIMALVGLVLWATVGGLFFLFGCGVALLGAHLKLTGKPLLQRIMIRVDETGRLVERDLPVGA